MLTQFVTAELDVTEDLAKQTRPNVFAGVDENDGGTTVWMPQEVVATPAANEIETEMLERGDELPTSDSGELGQSETRCTPTKLS